MSRLTQLRPVHIAVACTAWAAFVVLVPRLTVLAAQLYFTVQAMLSPTSDRAVAFGAHWTSWQSLVAAVAVPPALLLCAWMVSRLMHPRVAP